MSECNENRLGYKETKIGWIPRDWEVRPFGEIAKRRKDRFDPNSHGNSYSCIELEHIGQGTGIILGHVDSTNQASSKNKFFPGDILFGKLRPYLRKYAQVDFEGVCSSEIWVLQNQETSFSEYIYLIVQSNKFITFSNKTSGTKMPRAEWGLVSEVSFPLPPLPEQRKIAEILSTWDRAIELAEKQIEAKQRLKKGLMQQLLTGKMRFPGFGKPVTGNEIPEGWQEFRMLGLGTYYSGLSGKSKDDFGAGSPYIPYLNVFQNHIVDNEFIDYVKIKDSENQNLVMKGDVIFTLSSETPKEVGMSSVVMKDIGECYLNSFCMGFRLNQKDQLIPEYAAFLFRGPVFRREIFKYAQGSTRFNLSKRGFMKMIIRLPSVVEQSNISNIFSALDMEIANFSKKAVAMRQQKQGLLQKLLTGEVRVKV